MPPVDSSPALVFTRDAILKHAQALPAAPQVLGGLCELLEDMNTDLDQIAEQIRVDPALSARLVRISNSVAFGGAGSVGSIDEAVSRVGFSEITRLVGIATVAGLVDSALATYGIAAERLRESLLFHALASEAVAQFTAIEPRTAYAAGLLRGVGMMVIDRSARGRLAAGDVFDATRFASYAEWEQTRFGVTNPEVTRMILDEWRFPAESISAIERHLEPSLEGEDHVLEVVLNLAGAIVSQRGLGLAGDEKHWQLTPEKLAAAGLDEEQWQAASEQSHRLFESQKRALY